MLDGQLQRAPQAELADQLHRVACGPVLDDPPVLEAADHDAAQFDLATLVSATQGPARGDLVALADLILNLESEIREELEVEGNRLTGAGMAAVGEAVDVVDEVGVVVARDAVEVAARADLLKRVAGGLSGWSAVVAVGIERLSSFRLRLQSG